MRYKMIQNLKFHFLPGNYTMFMIGLLVQKIAPEDKHVVFPVMGKSGVQKAKVETYYTWRDLW